MVRRAKASTDREIDEEAVIVKGRVKSEEDISSVGNGWAKGKM